MVLAEVAAEVGQPYILQRRPGRGGLGVIRLARKQANGRTVSFVLGPEDARNVAAALFAAAARLDIEGTMEDHKI